jgi:hypothetical protein
MIVCDVLDPPPVPAARATDLKGRPWIVTLREVRVLLASVHWPGAVVLLSGHDRGDG